jgi:hypothetical protein
MKSVITALVPDNNNLLVGVTPFKLELKGKPEPRVRIEKIQDMQDGSFTVRIVAPSDMSLSTLDAVARRLLPNARVYAGSKLGPTKVRLYS